MDKKPIERACDLMSSQAALARAIGVAPSTVSQWISGERPIPEFRCQQIERLVNGLVTCEELRSDLNWTRIKDKSWPHPKGRPLVDHSKAA